MVSDILSGQSMTRRVLIHYLLPTMIHIAAVTGIAAIFKLCGIKLGYGTAAGITLIVLGGASSAFWGGFFQCRQYHKTVKGLIRDFFNVKQSYLSYLIAVIFVKLIFLGYSFPIAHGIRPILYVVTVFARSILFGGIEEIGWRFTFQPVLEKKIRYVPATLVTFLCWGSWHIMFFYIDGTLEIMIGSSMIEFLIGLLVNCFVLSALYRYSHSLWICVMTHALINTGSLWSIGGEEHTMILLMILSKVSCIVFALILVHNFTHKKKIVFPL